MHRKAVLPAIVVLIAGALIFGAVLVLDREAGSRGGGMAASDQAGNGRTARAIEAYLETHSSAARNRPAGREYSAKIDGCYLKEELKLEREVCTSGDVWVTLNSVIDLRILDGDQPKIDKVKKSPTTSLAWEIKRKASRLLASASADSDRYRTEARSKFGWSGVAASEASKQLRETHSDALSLYSDSLLHCNGLQSVDVPSSRRVLILLQLGSDPAPLVRLMRDYRAQADCQ